MIKKDEKLFVILLLYFYYYYILFKYKTYQSIIYTEHNTMRMIQQNAKKVEYLYR